MERDLKEKESLRKVTGGVHSQKIERACVVGWIKT
jgi:hypothetical protein